MLIIQKRGQITFFILLGIIILFSVGLFIFLNKQSKPSIDYTDYSDADTIQLYYENSLRIVTDDCFYDIGLHGGFIDPAVAAFYGDSVHAGVISTEYSGEYVPVYITDVDRYDIPSISEIEERLEKYILVKFYNSIDLDSFRKQDINVIGPSVDFSSGYNIPPEEVSIDVKIRDNDIIVNLEYPFIIDRNNSRTIIKDFSYRAPFRFKLVYNAIVDTNKGVLDAISDKWKIEEMQDNTFYLEDFNCDPLDSKYFITIYSLNNGISDERIIRVIDYQNFFNTANGKGFVYQFAVKKNPILFSGNICKGTIIN